MAAFQKKRFEKPDETVSPPNAKVETVRMGDLVLARSTYMPGWKWSKDIKPLVGTKSCQKRHFGYCLSGRLAGKLDDGSKWEFGPGDVVEVPPGHDGWVVGDEPVVFLEISHTPTSK